MESRQANAKIKTYFQSNDSGNHVGDDFDGEGQDWGQDDQRGNNCSSPGKTWARWSPVR